MGIERWWRSTDRALVLVTLALTLLGLLFIGSASHINQAGLHVSDYLAKQAAFLVADIAIFVYLLRFDYRKLYRYAPALYGANLVVLIAVMVVGTSALGAQRWITIGPISIQPSEFAKIIYIVCLARFLCRPSLDLKKWSGLFYTALFLLPPFVLVLLQPDLGTSLVFGAITLGGLYIAGVRMDYIRKMCLAGLAVLPLA
ncbi:MAG: FtsW/RodA/SpoVE family cell cycle protein, partial [Negativicoccus succinicivorans]|nr:FtsW/RodA/SpoVE family cell cycle protein [Negativicoccus succinicivorans]